jgi:hypothetical protein
VGTDVNTHAGLGFLASLLGASTGAAASALSTGEPDPGLSVSMAGFGGALGYGAHIVGKAVVGWLEADAAMRRELAGQVSAVRLLAEEVHQLVKRVSGGVQ